MWVSYYYRPKGTQAAIALGQDLTAAKAKWAQLEGSTPAVGTFEALRELHRKGPGKEAHVTTQASRDTYWKRLAPVFGHMRLESLTAAMMRLYFDKRTHKHAARHELLYLSVIFNWAAGRGYLPQGSVNPMSGLLRQMKPPNGTGGRTVYVTDEMFAAVYRHAHPILQDVMDLLYLTGQRPGDVCAMTWEQIHDGFIHIKQRKTGTALRIALTGQLAEIVSRIRKRTTVSARYVFCGPAGQRLGRHGWLRDRFDEARKQAGTLGEFQLRDLRAKTATDMGDMAKARLLLGHATQAMTTKYVQDRAGEVVQPLGVGKQRRRRKETGNT